MFQQSRGGHGNHGSRESHEVIAVGRGHRVCIVVPGNGFRQKEGTWHFRSTFLPPEELFDGFCKKLEEFHKSFLLKYSNGTI
ncbi:1082_t:CDS:2 [Entrophospora sp. SA101]|nr:1082_t:CDS:2 [Entrophospora sp. SA101]